MSVLKAERSVCGDGSRTARIPEILRGGEGPEDVPGCGNLQPVSQKGWTLGGWTLAKKMYLHGFQGNPHAWIMGIFVVTSINK